MPWTDFLRGSCMTIQGLPYLIVTMDYTTTCAGTCPTCVLGKAERLEAGPASTVKAITIGMKAAAAQYGYAETLAVGIGRANVLMLPHSSITEIIEILEVAKREFKYGSIIAEISTSLIGKIEPQIERAKEIATALEGIGVDARFVVVGNTALVSEKYWANLDQFLGCMEEFRGGRKIEGNGDILQLALSVDSLPDPVELTSRMTGYGFPINVAWAPGHDRGARSEEGLERLKNWLGDFYDLSVVHGLDSSLVNRIDAAVDAAMPTLTEAAQHAARSSEAIVYIAPDGRWHNGLFTALAEMDPIRFDPVPSGKTMAGVSARELRQFMTNPACAACPFTGPCVSAGGHKIAQISLRNFTQGTKTCPNGLQKSFAKATQSK
jgi:hypothetical protein